MVMNVRVAVVKALAKVVDSGLSFSSVQETLLERVPEKDRSLAVALCFGVFRHYFSLQAQLRVLVAKPLKKKDHDVELLIMVALYQLQHQRVADYAAVTEAVSAARAMKKKWACRLVNGVLRNFSRRSEAVIAEARKNHEALHEHPQWFLDQLQRDWPDDWQQIVAANNQHPPMVLRVNRRQISRADYLARLKEASMDADACQFSDDGILLKQPVPVAQLPGFFDGLCSVQDEAAQLAAKLLNPAAGMRVLDACSAPGGKACHLLEREADLAYLCCVDVEPGRVTSIDENLERLSLAADVRCADVADTSAWWDGQLFDRILLDAPCSAVGVIRRHPDIKLLRRSDDIVPLAQLQRKILEQLWPLLAVGGQLLYATCSISAAENRDTIGHFLASHSDAFEREIDLECCVRQDHGYQILPGQHGMDGFYYASLVKSES